MPGQSLEDPPVASASLGPDDAGVTFTGRDPARVAAAAIASATPTRCQARTRLYRDGKLELEGFPVTDISDYLAEASTVVWLDLRDPAATTSRC